MCVPVEEVTWKATLTSNAAQQETEQTVQRAKREAALVSSYTLDPGFPGGLVVKNPPARAGDIRHEGS